MTVQVDRSLQLPETEYFPGAQKKSGIALHHTVSNDAETTVRLWRLVTTTNGTPRRVATAYVIDRDGTIYEVFDPAAWAWQFGVRWPRADRIAFEKRFIGIEIISEGGLTEHDGKLYAYDLIDPVFSKQPDEAFECATPYRGYRWFDRYEPEQLQAVGRLVDDLCGRFAIPLVYPEKPFLYYGDALESFEGVIGHAMVRSDKSDPAPDPELWKTLETMADLRPTAIAAPLTNEDIETLFDRNVHRLNRMNTAAGSLVKHLLMELERRRTYLRLEDPNTGEHTIGYDVVQGDRELVNRIGNALGFGRVTETELEVRDA